MRTSSAFNYNKKASILIIAFWVLIILSIFVLQLGSIVRQKATLAHRLNTRGKLHFIAEAGVYRALLELQEDDLTPSYDALNEPWSNNAVNFKQVRLGQGSFTVAHDYDGLNSRIIMYGAVDEDSKININTSDVVTITRLFQAAISLDETEAKELAYSVIDWRDSDSFLQHMQYGAEDSDYKDLDRPYESKDSVFESIEELLLIKGMNLGYFNKIKNFVTVYGEGKININTAPRNTLLALGIAEVLVDKILSFRSGEDLIEGSIDDNIFSGAASLVPRLSQVYEMNITEIAQLSNLVSQGVFTSKSNLFTIKSQAELPGNKQKAQIVAISGREGNIKSWRENY